MDVQVIMFLFGLLAGFYLSRRSPLVPVAGGFISLFSGFYSYGPVAREFAVPLGLGFLAAGFISVLYRHGGSIKGIFSEAGKVSKGEKKEEKDLAEVFGDVESIERGILSEYESIYKVAREVKIVDEEIITMYRRVFEFIEKMLREIDAFISKLRGFWGRLNRQMVYRWWVSACVRVKKDLEETLEYIVKTIPETALSFEGVAETLKQLDETSDKLLDRVFRFINDVKKADIDELRLGRELEKYVEQLERLELRDVVKEVREAYRAEEEKARAEKRSMARELAGGEEATALEGFKNFKNSVETLHKLVLGFRKMASYYLREVREYGESIEELVKYLDRLEEGVRKLKGREGVEKWLTSRVEVVRKNVQAKAYDAKSEFHNIADKEYIKPYELISAFWKGVDEMSKSLLAEISSFEKDLDQLEMDYKGMIGELRAALNTIQEDIKDLELYQKNVLEKLKKDLDKYIIQELKGIEGVLRAGEGRGFVNRASHERIVRTLEALKAMARELQSAIREDERVSGEAAKLYNKIVKLKEESKDIFNKILNEIEKLKAELGVISSNVEKFRGAVAVRLREGIKKMDHLRELLEREERAYEMLIRQREMAGGAVEEKGREAPLPRAR